MSDRAMVRSGYSARDAEALVFAALSEAAEAGHPCPSNETLSELLGGYALSAPPQIIARLVRRGLLSVQIYQKSREVTIVATGKSTAPPRNRAPHWRDRPRDVPAPPVHVIQAKRPDSARDIFDMGRRMGRMPADFLADLVWVGWAHFQDDEIQAGTTEGLV